MESKINKINDKKIEEAMREARKKSDFYLILATIILFLTNLGAATVFTGLPIFLYNHRYLCKEEGSNIFTQQCEISTICSDKAKIGEDYILDKKNDLSINSFITQFDIYCENFKKSLLVSTLFLGGLLGTIIYPYSVTYLGLINTGKLFYLILSICDLLMGLLQYYTSTFILFTIASICTQIVQVFYREYITEMSDPLKRPIYTLFNILCFSFSELFILLATYLSKDYKWVLISSSCIMFIGLIFIHIFLVESIRISLIQNKKEEMIKNLEYIAKKNKSSIEFQLWKDKNLDFTRKSQVPSEPLIVQIKNGENEQNNNKITFEKINYCTIWDYPSQVKLIILFSVGTFFVNYNLYLIQSDLSRQNNFFISLLFSCFLDIIGISIGILINKIKGITRTSSYIILKFFLIVGFIISGIFYKNNYFSIFVFIRIIIEAENSNFALFSFEAFPTLTKPMGIAITRIFGKLFNILTPFLINSIPVLCYMLGILFSMILILLTFALGPDDTKDAILYQFPKELLTKDLYKNNNSDYNECTELKDDLQNFNNDNDEEKEFLNKNSF